MRMRKSRKTVLKILKGNSEVEEKETSAWREKGEMYDKEMDMGLFGQRRMERGGYARRV